MLTKKQIKDYLRHCASCPHCGSDDIEADNIDSDNCDLRFASSITRCNVCKETWMDIYQIVNVQELGKRLKSGLGIV